MFRTSLPINENQMGKQVKRVLNKPTFSDGDDNDNLQPDRSLSPDPEFSPNDQNSGKEWVSGDEEVRSPSPERPRASSSARKSKRKSRKSKSRANKRKRRMADESPTDSSDFDARYSSNYEDEFDQIN